MLCCFLFVCLCLLNKKKSVYSYFNQIDCTIPHVKSVYIYIYTYKLTLKM